MNPYSVQLEIAGPTALWARLDTMPNPVSCVAPSFSAVKGIFEAIRRWKSVNVRPTRCGRRGPHPPAPVPFHRYAFNDPDPASGLRRSGQMRDGTARPFAHRMGEGGQRPGEGRRWHKQGILSTSAAPDAVGLFPDGITPRATENHAIPAFLDMVFDRSEKEMNARLN